MKILCFGDSNTFGYDPRSYLADRYEKNGRWVDLLDSDPRNIMVNAGENGREIPYVPTQWQALNRRIQLESPLDLIIVMLGTNDLLQGRGAEETAHRMERFLRRVEFSPEKILLVAPPALQRGVWVTAQTMIEASQVFPSYLRAMAKDLGVRYLDAQDWSLPLAFDGVHFTQEGHRRFAFHLMNYLTKEFYDD